ncbi:hypothetical protein KAS31_01865 [Candidatus Parcubacteria bacterium]|nr:hypothetical protein [Candidatus Parcubacteria bacterium]
MKEQMPQTGDVIVSPKFAYGYYKSEEDKNIIIVDGKTIEHPVTSRIGEDERVKIAAETGKAPPRNKITELGAYDHSRASAKFVVESAKMQGGDTGRDAYPDGWHVKARRLAENDSYDPNGELIKFYMSGCFTYMVELEDVEIVSKMKREVKFT